MAQAALVKAALESLAKTGKGPEIRCETVAVQTTGDRIVDRPLREVGGKGLFIKELDRALYAQEIDVAVHSMKDVPGDYDDRIGFSAYLPREDPADVLIAGTARSIRDLPRGARFGTSSLRRQSQILSIRSDLKIETLRGNVQSRIDKIVSGDLDATFLAQAGLSRLGLQPKIATKIAVDEILPAVGQGAVGVGVLRDRADIGEMVRLLDDPDTRVCVEAERAFLKALDGTCRSPIAGFARLNASGDIDFEGRLLSDDGVQQFSDRCTASRSHIGRQAAAIGRALRNQAGETFIAQFLS
jgi:hydroxymethylbilane synthase